VLLDISGSMDRYARLFLHYVHGLTRRHLKVHTFTFGTRLTNITRCLRHRDPDVALKMADAGTRLEGRHAHRVEPARLQPPLGAPRAGRQRRGAAGHRRPGPRRGRPARQRGAHNCTAWRTRSCG
jgi:hypothetical protein